MITKLKFWAEGETIKMTDEKYQFKALGIYLAGYNLERLEWAIATINNPTELATFIGQFRMYEQVYSFEDIGLEAKNYHNLLSNYGEQAISEDTKNKLRDTRTRWDIIIRERLEDLYLVTSKSKIDPRHLMRGIVAFLNEEQFSFLEEIEVSDLNEACRCILVGSATAAEHIALRAAENLLRRWHEHKTSKVMEYKTWGTVLDRLVKEYPEEKKRPKEIAFLGYLKQRRDEVAHPDRISSLTEAETMLMNICCLIEGIEPVLATLAFPPLPDTQLPISHND